MNWLRGEQYDALMNYPLSQPAIDFFANQDINKGEMVSRVNTANLMYPKPIQEVMLNLVDSMIRHASRPCVMVMNVGLSCCLPSCLLNLEAHVFSMAQR